MSSETPTPPARTSDLLLRTLSGIVMMAIALGSLYAGGPFFLVLVLIVAAAMSIEWVGLTRQAGFSLKALGLPYVLLPTISLLALRDSADGFALTLWTLAIVWATDIGAYFTGRALGGPKLAPRISPAKTWSGLLGGMAAAALVGGLMATQMTLPALCLWLAAPLGALAQAGDLFESWLKRCAGVKDSGKLLPGHGGVLDRIDGLVTVASVMGLMLWGQLI